MFVNTFLYNNIVFIIAGNKSDLFAEEQVSEQKGKEYAKKINAAFYLTSSLENLNIDEMFYQAGKMYLKQQENLKQRKCSIKINKGLDSSMNSSLLEEEKKKSKCCL